MRASDQEIQAFERLSARVLSGGLQASGVLLVSGLVLGLWPGDVRATRVLEAGIFVLMATPAARVLVSLVEYWRARDWFFVLTAAAVLLVLAGAVATALASR